MKVLSLFTGAGGFDLGLECAGFAIVGAVEVDPICRQTISANRAWRLSEKEDIHAYLPRELRREFNIRRRELDLISAGPPCQPFSKAGYWVTGDSKRMRDPRARTLAACMNILQEFLPKTFIIENVAGIAYAEKDEGLRYIQTRLKEINRINSVRYTLQVLHVNAAHYGIPQIRERIFMVGVRDGPVLTLPPYTHYLVDEDRKANPNAVPCTTAWEALHDAPSPKNRAELAPSGAWAELLPAIPEGRNYLWHTSKGGGYPIFGWRKKYWTFLLKLAKDRPSWTIQAQPGPATGPFHWSNRKLSVEELCRLQTFPRDYQVLGTYRQCVRQVGNAVPSALGELFGLEIRRQIFGQRVRRRLQLIPAKLQRHPSPERVQPVKRKYLKGI